MIRLKISNFIKKHKYKIQDLINKLVMVAVVVFIATIILSSFSSVEKNEEDNTKNVYKPTQTIIAGSDISQEQYEKDSNLVDTFLDACNNKQIDVAYGLLSDECKAEAFPTIEMFKTNYYDTIFDKKREYSLQAWISTKEYTLYQVRYTNNMLATGIYDGNDVYQDYITLNRKNNNEKISIGNFIDYEKCNVITKTDELEATVVKQIYYITYEEYEIKVKNKTDKTILLNNLKSANNISLVTATGSTYSAYTNKLFINDLIIQPGETRTITIRFKKNVASSNASLGIEIINIIKDYDTYKINKEEYTDYTSIAIEVED